MSTFHRHLLLLAFSVVTTAAAATLLCYLLWGGARPRSPSSAGGAVGVAVQVDDDDSWKLRPYTKSRKGTFDLKTKRRMKQPTKRWKYIRELFPRRSFPRGSFLLVLFLLFTFQPLASAICRLQIVPIPNASSKAPGGHTICRETT